MNLNIESEGYEKYIDGGIYEEIRDMMDNIALEAMNEYVETVAIPITPVLTGLLQKSYLPVRIEDRTIVIENKTNPAERTLGKEEYSERILWHGGSQKLPQGLWPSLDEFVHSKGGEITQVSSRSRKRGLFS